MRQRDAKIAIMDKAFQIFYFFSKELLNDEFLTDDKAQLILNSIRMNEIRYIAKILFNNETCDEIDKLLYLVADEKVKKSLSDDEYKEYAKDNGFESYLTEYTDDKPFNRHLIIYLFCLRRVHEIFEKYRLNL